MQAIWEMPCEPTQPSSRCQASSTAFASAQETPVARNDPVSATRAPQLCAEAPAGAVAAPLGGAAPGPVSAELLADDPQPPSRAAARASIAIGTANLIGRRQTYPPLASFVLGRPAGCRWAQIGQSASGTTASRSTSIVRRS